MRVDLEQAVLDFFRPQLRPRGGKAQLARDFGVAARGQLGGIFDPEDSRRLGLRHLDAYARAHKLQASELLRVLAEWVARREQAEEVEEGLVDAATARRLSGAAAGSARQRRADAGRRRERPESPQR